MGAGLLGRPAKVSEPGAAAAQACPQPYQVNVRLLPPMCLCKTVKPVGPLPTKRWAV